MFAGALLRLALRLTAALLTLTSNSDHIAGICFHLPNLSRRFSAVKILGIIPARYASTRFPGKPLALIAGKPLIQHVVERCRQAKSLSEVIVATDDARIAGGGAEVLPRGNDPRRSSERLGPHRGSCRALRVRRGGEHSGR